MRLFVVEDVEGTIRWKLKIFKIKIHSQDIIDTTYPNSAVTDRQRLQSHTLSTSSRTFFVDYHNRRIVQYLSSEVYVYNNNNIFYTRIHTYIQRQSNTGHS